MEKRILLSILAIICLTGQIQAQITGTVFRDYNIDGIFQPAAPNNEVGIAGIKIKIYDANNVAIDSTISGPTGTYTLPFTVPVRLEFEFMAATNCLDSTVDFNSFALGGDNVRFITIASNGIDYGIHNAQDYLINTNPSIFFARFNRGDPLVAGTTSTSDALYAVPYSSAGFAPTQTANSSVLGCIWGTAWSRQAQRLFAAAFMKRQSGYGPLGSGGIYTAIPQGTTFQVATFYDMDANGHRTRAAASAVTYGAGSSFSLNAGGTEATYLGPVDPLSGSPEGLGVIGANGTPGRGMTGNVSDQSNDPAACDQVGKVGLGDLEISEDGRFLFVTNLYSKLVYRLELDNPYNPTGVIAVDSFALPSIAVNNGVLRCFGLAYHRGDVYVGAVSTGENGGQNVVNGATDLYAYVFKLQKPLTAVPVMNPTPVLTFPLNYLKGAVIGGSGTQWYPWNKKTNILLPGEPHLPTAMVSDIAFSDRGDMILDLCDRTGHQFQISNYLNLSGTSMAGSIDIGGDILIAGYDCGTGNFSLENNGSYTSQGTNFTSAGAGNNEGIGGGEFFYNDEWASFHHETSVGSCATMRGKNQVVVSLMDPVTAFSNGCAKFDLSNAANTDNMTMATSVEMGKANSMGDIEIAADPAPLQIGNRVWRDENANGIQDPDETGIANVTVELLPDFDNNGVPDGGAVGSTQSNNAGYFYFDPSNVVDGDPVISGVQPGPVPRRYYLVRIGTADWAAGAGVNDLFGMTLSVNDIGGPGQADVRDNDGVLLNNIPTIDSVRAKQSGSNTHMFDFGFIPCPPITPSDVTINCANPSLTIGPVAQAGSTYSWTPPTGLSATDIAQPIATPDATTTYTLTVNKLCTYVYTAFVDTDPPEVEAGPGTSLECDIPSVVIGTPGVSTNSYSWSPGNSLNDSTLAQPIASPKSTTQYTLTVTGMNGCKKYDVVTIERDPCCARIVIPNSFTPNNDGLNDKFGVIVIENVETFYLTIYNRWGQRVFETEDPMRRWDGMIHGKKADNDTYFYYIKYNCRNFKKPRFMKGDVTLER